MNEFFYSKNSRCVAYVLRTSILEVNHSFFFFLIKCAPLCVITLNCLHFLNFGKGISAVLKLKEISMYFELTSSNKYADCNERKCKQSIEMSNLYEELETSWKFIGFVLRFIFKALEFSRILWKQCFRLLCPLNNSSKLEWLVSFRWGIFILLFF